MAVTSYRRYCLGKRIQAREACDSALELAWAGKQQAEPGTALPVSFPHRAKLECIGYVADTDLEGATATELELNAGLSPQEAAAVLTAAAAL
jgi:hypothetical protein